MAWIFFAILVICLQIISIYIEIATAKYPPTYYILAEAVVVIAAAAGVLTIGERIGVMAERVTLRPYILPRVGVLIGGEVLVRGRNIIVQAGIVRV